MVQWRSRACTYILGLKVEGLGEVDADAGDESGHLEVSADVGNGDAPQVGRADQQPEGPQGVEVCGRRISARVSHSVQGISSSCADARK